ncbi:MAG: methyltransferase domain-containing protein, partial [Spirochaetales bacterium]|nr:methyltransferase domain-containing protein [Spirochaetales bacterium]
MKAIILAAGEGTRLGDLARDKPKCLVDIEGNTLLELQLNTLHTCGIDDIIIVKGYEADKIDIPGVTYFTNHEYNHTNMLTSLFCAEECLHGEVIILYSDILYEKQVIERMINSAHDIAVGVMVNWKEAIRQRNERGLEDLEMIYFDSENRIEETGRKKAEDHKTAGQFIGIVKCSKRGTEIIKNNYKRIKNFYNNKPFREAAALNQASIINLFQEMTELGIPLHCVIIEQGWMEIDTPEDYERAITDTQFVRRIVRVKTDWNHRAQFYNNLEWTKRDELLTTIVDVAEDLQNKQVLDLGTGTGKVLMALYRKWPDAAYYGLDISQGMLDKIDSSFQFNLSIGEMENLCDYGDESFHLVTSRMAFHHSKNIKKAMKEVCRVLKKGGKFIICEGNPPDVSTLDFYTKMFWFKEDRITFLLDDLVNLFVYNNFSGIRSRTIIYKQMSLNNWLDNSGLPLRNIDIIKKMHYEADCYIKDAYNMVITEDDILMDWKFSVVSGIK